MRTISINLYTFGELEDTAQDKALEQLRDKYIDECREYNVDDAMHSIDSLALFTGVNCELRRTPSGWIATNTTDNGDTAHIDRERWCRLVEATDKDDNYDYWCDFDMRDAIKAHDYDDTWTFALNVTRVMTKFMNLIDGYEPDTDKELLGEWIESHGYEFCEDGTLTTKHILPWR